MVFLLLGTTRVVTNLSLAMAMSTMEMVLQAIAMLDMEANVLLCVEMVATPATHLLPTPQTLGGHNTHRHRIIYKKVKVKLDL